MSIPPALVVLALVALGVPAASRALLGRPRLLGAAWVAAVVGVLAGQTVGELTVMRTGVLGDAHVVLAAIGAALASAFVAAIERGR